MRLQRFQIEAGAERAVGAAQHHCAQGGLAFERFDGLAERFGGGHVDGIAGFRPVQGDLGPAVMPVEQDGGIACHAPASVMSRDSTAMARACAIVRIVALS
ncbi:hypothetical protein D3C71_1918820 [compost metagenome]